MQTSEHINELAEALAVAQGSFAKVTKGKTAKIETKTGPGYKYQYADLGEVIETTRPTLKEHGLSVVQMPSVGPDNRLTLCTMLMHKSGQWIRGEIPIQWNGGDPKSLGSLLTYLRRYTYTGAIGVATEEDDDGQAAGTAPKPDAPKRPAPPKLPAKSTEEATADEMQRPAGNGVKVSFINSQGRAFDMTEADALKRLYGAAEAHETVDDATFARIVNANALWLPEKAEATLWQARQMKPEEWRA